MLVETAIFFLSTILLFFVIFNFGIWLREMNVVTEAARHGGRSLAADTVRDGICGDDDALKVDAGNWVSCAGLATAAPTSGTLYSAIWPACEYLNRAGYNEEEFSVRGSPVSGGLSENHDPSLAKVNPAYHVTVEVVRSAGRACIFCRLFSFGRTRQSITFPLNPFKFTVNGLIRCNS